MLKWTNSAQNPAEPDKKIATMEREQTPHIKKRLRKRTTICQFNKENIVPITSTPFGTQISKLREVKTRDSMSISQFASTLPRFEEEYSPSTILPSGQELASRGLFPDVFIRNQRYFESPFSKSHEDKQQTPKRKLEFELNEGSLQIMYTLKTLQTREV